MYRLIDGGVKFALYMPGITPDDEQTDALFRVDGIEEVSSEGCQDYKVVFYLHSIEELTPERLIQAKRDVNLALIGKRK